MSATILGTTGRESQDNSPDCSRFTGRKLAICNGTAGLPEHQRLAYLDLWAGQKPRQHGLGDTVAWLIKLLTFGRLRAKANCGCAKRRDWLNRLFPYGRGKSN